MAWMRGLLNVVSSRPATALWWTRQAGVVILLLEWHQEVSTPEKITELYCGAITKATLKTVALGDECGSYGKKTRTILNMWTTHGWLDKNYHQEEIIYSRTGLNQKRRRTWEWGYWNSIRWHWPKTKEYTFFGMANNAIRLMEKRMRAWNTRLEYSENHLTDVCIQRGKS